MLFYMSFADDDSFRGAVITHAENEIAACLKTHQMNINPGGEILFVDASGSPLEAMPQWWDRLLTREEVAQLD